MNVMMIAAGAGGGVLRGVFGLAKSAALKEGFRMNWPWFLVTVLVSAIVGVVAASFFGEDLRLALLAGYVGADFIDGLIDQKLKEMFDPKKTVTSKKTGSFADLLRPATKK